MKDRLISAFAYVQNDVLSGLLFIALGLCIDRVPEFDRTIATAVSAVCLLAGGLCIGVAARGFRMAMVPPPPPPDPVLRADYDAWTASPDGQAYLEWLKWSDAFFGAVEGAKALAIKGVLSFKVENGVLLVTRPDDLQLDRSVTCSLHRNRLRICRYTDQLGPCFTSEPRDMKHAAEVIGQSFGWLVRLPPEELLAAGGEK